MHEFGQYQVIGNARANSLKHIYLYRPYYKNILGAQFWEMSLISNIKGFHGLFYIKVVKIVAAVFCKKIINKF